MSGPLDIMWPLLYGALPPVSTCWPKPPMLILFALLLNAFLRGPTRLLTRSAMWNSLITGLLLLPATTLLSPRMRIACLPPLLEGCATRPTVGAGSRLGLRNVLVEVCARAEDSGSGACRPPRS